MRTIKTAEEDLIDVANTAEQLAKNDELLRCLTVLTYNSIAYKTWPILSKPSIALSGNHYVYNSCPQ